jgi:hypothetical protein
LGGVNGTLVGKIAAPPTSNGWGTYKTVSGDLTQKLTGIQDVYFVLTGTTSSALKYIGNFDNASFSYVNPNPTRSDYAKLELEKYDEWSTALNVYNNNSPLKTEGGRSGDQVANTFNGAWLGFKKMNFGIEGVDRVAIEYSGNSGSCPTDAAVEIRLGGVDGTLVGKLSTPPTASGWGAYQTVTADLTQKLTGLQSVYLVFTGTNNSTKKYIGNFDNARFSLNVQ